MKRTVIRGCALALFATTIALASCGGNSQTPPAPHVSSGTWVSGANTTRSAGVYGTQGTASPSNVPGARQFPASWTDNSGNLWLFGGNGLDSAGSGAYLNDLWKFDGTNWTWVSGSNLAGQAGVYGTKGTAASNNVPGARAGSLSWRDNSGNLWLFGGSGVDSAGTTDSLNDLWKFDGANWTWVSGSNVAGQAGVYGTKGAAASVNVPGARLYAVSWTDKSGGLWSSAVGVWTRPERTAA